MVARDFSFLAAGAERNVDASHTSLPVTAPRNLTEPQHQDDNPSPACTVARWSQDWDEAEKSSRRIMREGSQSPPTHPKLPMTGITLGAGSALLLGEDTWWVQGSGEPWHLQGDVTKTHTGTTGT